MAALTDGRIRTLLEPYVAGTALLEGELAPRLSAYLDLLLRWTARTNLTAITDPEEIVQRHFGESLFLARYVAKELPDAATVLDFGSGAGFPGVPLALACPGMRVTLAESQGKKAAFLREVTRTLELTAEVWAGRVEAMPSGKVFACVTMRAVDRMEAAVPLALARVGSGGLLAVLGGDSVTADCSTWNNLCTERVRVPGRERAYLHVRRVDA